MVWWLCVVSSSSQKSKNSQNLSSGSGLASQLITSPRPENQTINSRVELIIKKFKIFLGGKTVVTIYRIKAKFVDVIGFLYISKCSELTIFGVKVTLMSIDPKFSCLACRILQFLIIYPNKFIDLWLKNQSLNQCSVLVSIWGVKCPRLTFTPLVMTSGEFLTNSRCINHQLSYVFW